MTASLLRHAPIPEVGAEFVIDGAEGRHGAAALRLREGEAVLVGDGAGVVADCTVLAAAGSEVRARVDKRREYQLPRPHVRVVQGLPKSDRSELAVESATEAGADEIIPWQADRCISRWTGPKIERGRAKWQNAVRAAAKQSRRPFEPEVGPLLDSKALAAAVGEWTRAGDVVIVLHEDAAEPFGAVVREAIDAAASGLVLVVGPEGGIAEAELDALREPGARTALLGPEVLRTSTAAAVALGAIGVLTSRWAID